MAADICLIIMGGWLDFGLMFGFFVRLKESVRQVECDIDKIN